MQFVRVRVFIEKDFASMAQSSLMVWARPGTKCVPPADVEFDRCRKACEELGLPWPHPVIAKNPGWPRYCDQYIEELYKLIRANRLPQGATKEAPHWWRPGKAVARVAEDVLAAVAEPTTLRQGGEAGSEAEGVCAQAHLRWRTAAGAECAAARAAGPGFYSGGLRMLLKL